MNWSCSSQKFSPSVGGFGNVLQGLLDKWTTFWKWARLILITESVWMGCVHE